MTHPTIMKLIRDLEDLRKEVRDLKAPQLAYSSVEDGAVEVNDASGQTTAILGKQFDDTFTAASVAGPVPPSPRGAVADPVPGGVVVSWPGLFADDAVSPMDFARVSVHAIAETEATGEWWKYASSTVATFETAAGGSASVSLPAVPHTVVLVARSQSGKASDASPMVSVMPIAAASQADLDEVLASANGKNSVTFSATPPGQTPGKASGDLWWQREASGSTWRITGQWVWDGAAWAQAALTSATVAALDAGVITTGQLSGITVIVGTPGSGHWELQAGTEGRTILAHSGHPAETKPGGITSRVDYFGPGWDGYLGGVAIQAPENEEYPGLAPSVELVSGGSATGQGGQVGQGGPPFVRGFSPVWYVDYQTDFNVKGLNGGGRVELSNSRALLGTDDAYLLVDGDDMRVHGDVLDLTATTEVKASALTQRGFPVQQVASGSVSIAPTAANTTTAANVVFPVGMFTQSPRVTVAASTGFPQSVRVSISAVSKTGCTINLNRTDTTTTGVNWIAVGT